MKFKDYYRVFGVAPEATADEIKIAYRKLARKFHPDVSKEPGAEQRFTELGEANEVLKDPKRRADYDALRAAGWKDGQEMDAPPPQPGYRRASGMDEDDHFSDFFQSLFGGRAPGGGRRGGFADGGRGARGRDILSPLVISVEEAFHGGQRQLQLAVPELNAHGEVENTTRTITVTIAPGSIAGARMRLRGQGHAGSTADLGGDLILTIELAPHRWYQVAGRDLTLAVPITPWEAVLGAQVAVPTLGGTVTATIPAGARSGQKLRLKGRGLPSDTAGAVPGDQYLELQLVLPPTASEPAKELYRALAKDAAFDPRAHLGV